MTQVTLGVDIGGAKIAAALVTKDGAVLGRQTVATPVQAGATAILAALYCAWTGCATPLDLRAVAARAQAGDDAAQRAIALGVDILGNVLGGLTQRARSPGVSDRRRGG